MTALDKVTAALLRVTEYEPKGGSARCPAHEDSSPSLSVSQGDKGAVVYCHVGCTTESVLDALGLEPGDLFDEKTNGTRNGKAVLGPIVATYDYVDEHRTLLYQAVRYNEPQKNFRQRRPDGTGGWIWNLGDTRRVLYRLPAVLDAVKAGRTIYVVEGEKDVEALERAGIVATTNAMGAAAKGTKSKWRAEYTDTLRGAVVKIVADWDDAGRQHAAHVAQVLDGVARHVSVWCSPAHKDAADHLAAGLTWKEFVPITERATPTASSSAPPSAPSGNAEELAGVDGHRYTDSGNADRLIAAHGDRIRYVPAWGRWLTWTGCRWKVDVDDVRVTELAKDVARRLLRLTATVTGDERRNLVRWGTRSEMAGSLAAMIRLARAIPGIAVDHADLDADPWLLAVNNGVIDLRDGQRLEHNPERLITRVAPVDHHPDAVAPRFAVFLEQILPDPDVRAYLQRFAGYCLTGSVAEQILTLWWGVGRNGKSTLITILRALLGDYAALAARELLIVQHHEQHPTALADLFRARLATCVELRDRAPLDEARVKALTGGDDVKARRMREDFWSFTPTHKLVVATNHKPAVRADDFALWRRVHLVPFTEIIPADQVDPHLAERIIATEMPGILAWALAGVAAYRTDGLKAPAAVVAATADYQAEADTVAAFFTEEEIVFGDGWYVKSGQLQDAHDAWCREQGLNAASHWHQVQRRLKERGATPGRTGATGRLWRGVAMRSDQDEREGGDAP